MRKTERVVLCYDISINTKPETSKPITIDQAIQLISELPESDRSLKNKSKKEYFYLSDIKKENDMWYILLNKSDQDISDPIFSDPIKQKRRTARKEENEGQDFSSHILIKQDHNSTTPGIMLVLLCQ